MTRTHIVKRGGTLARIAEQYYGDAQLYEVLASYNGITDVNLVEIGQPIEIPSRRELLARPPAPPASDPDSELGPEPPHGLDEIKKIFGDITEYVAEDGSLDPGFQREHLARAMLPFAIKLSWEPSLQVRRLQCHKKLTRIFPAVFEAIEAAGLREKIRTCGGCFNYRAKRSGSKLSTHSWGIAIDLNVHTNPMGQAGDMDAGVVEIFRSFGFKWGGDWPGRGKDPMHFQYCTGY